MAKLSERFKSAWNAFNERDTGVYDPSYGYASSIRPDRMDYFPKRDMSMIEALYNRIAIDVAAVRIRHVRTDENGNMLEELDSSLNRILSVEANIDQSGRSLIQDIVMSMCDEGVVAVVPIDTTADPRRTDSYEILTLRVGKIIEWFPDRVRVRVYNDRTGLKEEIVVSKRDTAIIENPLYSVMNQNNSMVKRLLRKLALLDRIDEKGASGKLDMLIQLPYVIKTNSKMEQAENRRKVIEDQLVNSKYGIAYIDGTEKVIQLNRSLENNLMAQIEYLTKTLYGQLGITEEVFNGTANEQTMLNYYNRTIEPFLGAIADGFKRAFLSKTAIAQRQSISYNRDPFRLAPVEQIADMADKFTRNAILSSNEFRSIVGYKPVDDERADELRNKNLNASEQELSDPVLTNSNDETSNNQDRIDFINKKIEEA